MRKKRFLKVILIVLMCLLLVSPIAFATDNFDLNSFEGGTPPSTINNLTQGTIGTIISIIRVVGIGVAVVILMIIATKYMLSSPGDRADLKKHAVPFVIGAFVLFGTSQIIGIIADFAGTISGTP